MNPTQRRHALRGISRRDALRAGLLGVAGVSASGWLEQLALAAESKKAKSCILLWMSGGPSQMDTFDLKPGHDNGGPFEAIDTTVPGIQISEHLPKLAKHAKDLAIIRSMKTKEADHGRATYLMRTGRPPGGAVQFPVLGSFLAKELENPENPLPSFVSIAPYRFLSPGAFGSGFLGPRFAPLVVGESQGFVVRQPGATPDVSEQLKVRDLQTVKGVSEERTNARLRLLEQAEADYFEGRDTLPTASHKAAYQRAVKLMKSDSAKAFDLSDEPAKLRSSYGRNLFGQGCLLARRLVERGVPFVEVSLSGVQGVQALGWDTHQNNFPGVKTLSGVLDAGWSTLLGDLKKRGLLNDTLVVWMGEFGRTPKINRSKGRDHWANSWSTVLAGGGIQTGQVVGKTSDDGMEVKDRPVSVEDLLATVTMALGLDFKKQNLSNIGRPIRLVEPTAKPLKEVLS